MKSFLSDDSGQGLLEYALIIAFVAIVAVAAVRILGTRVSNSLNNDTAALS
jgi:pilus assembly protein Flp/PilA